LVDPYLQEERDQEEVLMSRAAVEDWLEDYIIVVPHAWRDEGLWIDMQSEAQERIGTTLREMYAELLQQPLSPCLKGLLRQIEVGSETLPHEC
jgi:hypothetical protein